LPSAIHGITVRGWAGLDPSNTMMTGNERIVLTQGRGKRRHFPVAGMIVAGQ